MTLNHKIENYLNECNKGHEFYPPDIYDKLFGQHFKNTKEWSLILNTIQDHDLITPLKFGSDLYVISPFGNEILEKGGWIKYVEILESREIERFEKERLETDLAKSNIEANKLNRKNSNFNIWFTVINVIIGIVNIIVALVN